jgi:hypothetical protein
MDARAIPKVALLRNATLVVDIYSPKPAVDDQQQLSFPNVQLHI